MDSFICDDKPPEIGVMLQDIEKTGFIGSKALSSVKKENWKSICSYTRTGALQVQRWNTDKTITPGHSSEEIEEVIRFVNLFGILSALGVAALMENESMEVQLYEKYHEITE